MVGIMKTTQEIEQLKQERQQLVTSQANELIKAIRDGLSPEELQDILERKKLKPEALKIAMDDCKVNGVVVPEIIEDYYIDRTIVPLKTRPIEFFANKTEGKTRGQIIRKAPRDNSKGLKYQNNWMNKVGHNDPELAPGMAACEYISTNLLNQIMGENSPKFRLHKIQQGEVTILSKFIPGFVTLSEQKKRAHALDLGEIKGFSNFFAANALIGNADLNRGNVGIRTDDNGNKFFATIDTGVALYYSNFQDEQNKADIQSFKSSLLKMKDIYSESLFHGDNFANELFTTLNDIDLTRTRKIISKSIQNLKEAYGYDFLKNPKVNRLFKARLGMTNEQSLTEESLKNKIVENMISVKEKLLDMSQNIYLESFVQNFKDCIANSVDVTVINTQLARMPEDIRSYVLSCPIDTKGNNAFILAMNAGHKELADTLFSYEIHTKDPKQAQEINNHQNQGENLITSLSERDAGKSNEIEIVSIRPTEKVESTNKKIFSSNAIKKIVEQLKSVNTINQNEITSVSNNKKISNIPRRP